MRDKLLDFLDKCGSFEAASMALRCRSVVIGNVALGYTPMPPGLEMALARVTDSARPHSMMERYMRLKGISTVSEAAALLGVSDGYLRQQMSMHHPNGAVLREVARTLALVEGDGTSYHTAAETLALARALAKKSGRPLVECVGQLAAQGRPVPGEYVGIAERARAEVSAESVAQHNARVLAERHGRGK